MIAKRVHSRTVRRTSSAKVCVTQSQIMSQFMCEESTVNVKSRPATIDVRIIGRPHIHIMIQSQGKSWKIRITGKPCTRSLEIDIDELIHVLSIYMAVSIPYCRINEVVDLVQEKSNFRICYVCASAIAWNYIRRCLNGREYLVCSNNQRVQKLFIRPTETASSRCAEILWIAY